MDLIEKLPSEIRAEALSLARRMAKPETEAEYHALLGSGGRVSPYESDYREPGCDGMREKGALLGDVAAFYRAFGFDSSNEILEPPDHVALELAFISYLKLKQAYALLQRRDEACRICLEAEEKFLKEHLSGWVPQLLDAIGREAEDGFYAEAGRFMKRFFPNKQQTGQPTHGAFTLAVG